MSCFVDQRAWWYNFDKLHLSPWKNLTFKSNVTVFENTTIDRHWVKLIFLNCSQLILILVGSASMYLQRSGSLPLFKLCADPSLLLHTNVGSQVEVQNFCLIVSNLRCTSNLWCYRPGDIQLIGAMGDGLIAGQGALSTDIVSSTHKYFGVSFATGNSFYCNIVHLELLENMLLRVCFWLEVKSEIWPTWRATSTTSWSLLNSFMNTIPW